MLKTRPEAAAPEKGTAGRREIDAHDPLLECDICQDPMLDPYTLACEHSFCGSCLEEWFRNLKYLPLRCPSCRDVVADTPQPNAQLRERAQDLVDSLEPDLAEKIRIRSNSTIVNGRFAERDFAQEAADYTCQTCHHPIDELNCPNCERQSEFISFADHLETQFGGSGLFARYLLDPLTDSIQHGSDLDPSNSFNHFLVNILRSTRRARRGVRGESSIHFNSDSDDSDQSWVDEGGVNDFDPDEIENILFGENYALNGISDAESHANSQSSPEIVTLYSDEDENEDYSDSDAQITFVRHRDENGEF